MSVARNIALSASFFDQPAPGFRKAAGWWLKPIACRDDAEKISRNTNQDPHPPEYAPDLGAGPGGKRSQRRSCWAAPELGGDVRVSDRRQSLASVSILPAVAPNPMPRIMPPRKTAALAVALW